jgi:hypothetical protein
MDPDRHDLKLVHPRLTMCACRSTASDSHIAAMFACHRHCHKHGLVLGQARSVFKAAGCVPRHRPTIRFSAPSIYDKDAKMSMQDFVAAWYGLLAGETSSQLVRSPEREASPPGRDELRLPPRLAIQQARQLWNWRQGQQSGEDNLEPLLAAAMMAANFKIVQQILIWPPSAPPKSDGS